MSKVYRLLKAYDRLTQLWTVSAHDASTGDPVGDPFTTFHAVHLDGCINLVRLNIRHLGYTTDIDVEKETMRLRA